MSNTPQEHAVFSASSAHRWMRCAGAIAMEQGMPDRSSGFAEEGTAAHEVCSLALKEGHDASNYLGHSVMLLDGKVLGVAPPYGAVGVPEGRIKEVKQYTVTQDMADHVQTYLDLVRGLCQIEGAMLFVEQRVQFGHVIGIGGQFGTSDATIVVPGEIIVVDFKYGMGVEVNAQDNEQLMLYALGALEKYKFIHGVQRVRMIICQPRINHMSEWSCSVEELLAFGRKARVCAAKASKCLTQVHDVKNMNPGEKQCRFCKAKAVCPALAAQVMASITDDFVDLDDVDQTQRKVENGVDLVKHMNETQLACAMSAAPLVEMWIKAVREEVYKSLMEGKSVKGFKLVRGKQGNRKWSDEKAAEEALIKTLGEEAHKKSLISPTDAEKKMKKVAPMSWPDIQSKLVTRSPGSLSVAPESDERQAESPSSEIEAMFDNLEGDE